MLIKASDLDVPEARRKLVERICGDVAAAKKHFNGDFSQMLEDMDIVREGRPKRWPKSNYIVNITQRYIRQKTAHLYAKNPRAVSKRRHRLDFQVWDGKPESLIGALAQARDLAAQGAEIPAEIQDLLMDISQGSASRQKLERIGKTMEVLWNYYTTEQVPSFKSQMKAAVRAAVSCGVGYVKLGFQRDTDFQPDEEASSKIADMRGRLAHVERLMAEMQSGDIDETEAEAEELRLAIDELSKEAEVVMREGLVFDFPFSTSIIPDPGCVSIKGWVGADWLAQELFLAPDEVKAFYKVDLEDADGGAYRQYDTRGKQYKQNPRADLDSHREDMACVWRVWHKPTGLVFVVADGYPDFLREPEPPVARVERFFPVYALTFNELTHATKIFPPSDVRLMLPQQEEMNRAGQARREHRRASRPGYVTPAGMLGEEDKLKLKGMDSHEVVELSGLVPGQKVGDLIQSIPKQGIDPGVYETGSIMNDIMWSVGAQEATFGGTSNSTATEASIAESNRTTATEAEIDELNDFLTELARDGGVVMLQEVSQETAMEIAGPGAMWPQTSAGAAQREVFLETIAGSNGRPNRAARQYALQQLTPFLLQIPGVNPNWLARLLVESLDDSIDMTEAVIEGLPAILGGTGQPSTGDQRTSPEMQGGKGANNQQQPAGGRANAVVPMGGQREQEAAA